MLNLPFGWSCQPKDLSCVSGKFIGQQENDPIPDWEQLHADNLGHLVRLGWPWVCHELLVRLLEAQANLGFG